MEKTVQEQIRSGLRLGIGLGGFFIAAMLIGNGISRILSPTGSHQIVWTNWTGWIELLLAIAILLPTARVWLMLIGGYMIFGVVKGLFLFATGNFLSHGFSTRSEPLEVTLYGVVTLVLLYRFAKNPPTVPDRVALTAFLICFFVPSGGPNAALSWSQMLGMAVLLACWGLAHWRAPHDSSNGLRG